MSGPHAEIPLEAWDGWGPRLSTATVASVPPVPQPTYDPAMLLAIVRQALIEDACEPAPRVPDGVLTDQASTLLRSLGVRPVIENWTPDI